MSNTICIGHGMGAHVCGMAGHMETEESETGGHTTGHHVPRMFYRNSFHSKSNYNIVITIFGIDCSIYLIVGINAIIGLDPAGPIFETNSLSKSIMCQI